jgi:hydroxyethylthiazole kinase-like uncharacterized protein yjeF
MRNRPVLVSVRQAREIDNKARKLLGISTLVLMENAGRAVAEESSRMSSGRDKRMLRCAIFCGKGNNGGDGFVAARHLLLKGIKPDIFLAAGINDVKNEARANLEIILKLKQKIFEVKPNNLRLVSAKLKRHSFIIDALLGIGLSGEVSGVFRDLIGIINKSKAKKLAVDIPSGLDADSGKVLGCCVKADTTVTFVAKKRGMVEGAGPKYCGRIVVRDLGIPLVNFDILPAPR